METQYVEFFKDLPNHAQLTIQALIPSKQAVLDTYFLACVAFQHAVLKKCVTDNMRDHTSKVVNQMLKRVTDTEQLTSYEDMQLSDECERLIENYLYVKHRYNNIITAETLTVYLSYAMIVDKALQSHRFFADCLFTKEYQNVIDELYKSLKSALWIDRSDVVEEFGQYLTNPLFVTRYECYGRDSEISECIHILSRRKKANAMLVGLPGVGKTQIAYGICNYLQSDKCPEFMRNYEVFSLDTTKLVSGTRYRGDLEARLDALITELEQCNNLIIFIDEIHMLFHSSSSDEPDTGLIQNALKSFLSESSKVIGCTTESGYKTIETDTAFERRFIVVPVKELDADTCRDVIGAARKQYERYHGVIIPDELVKDTVDLCAHYVKNRYFPDKALDCLDIACSACKLSGRSTLNYNDIERSAMKIAGISNNNFSLDGIAAEVDSIKHCIIGQDQAIDAVSKCLKRYAVGVNNKLKPIGSFLFVGSTGTGKTELCKQIAHRFFSAEGFIRFDMSEFMEAHSVSKLIGSPPGYVGFNQKGALTEKVKHNPFSLILFDEIEKAHKDVINLLLQIMDDGRLTDSYGTTVNFCNCIIVMTSNIGCREYLEKNSIGFGDSNNEDVLTKAVNSYFSPEFRNRLDGVIFFNKITRDSFNIIFKNELDSYIEKYRDAGVTVHVSDDKYNSMIDLCFDEKNGVRFVQRQIAKILDDEIMNKLVSGDTDITV